MLKLHRISWIVAGAAMAITALPAVAQDYPNKPIRMVIPYGQGGATDTIGRMVAGPLEAALGVPVVVTNQPGAGGAVGLATALQAAPDGYTIAVGSDSSLSARPLMTDSGYDINSIQPIARAVEEPMTFIVKADSELDNIDDLVAGMQDGNLTWSSPGVGSGPFLGAESFFDEAGVQGQHVTAASAGESLVKLMSGEVKMVSVVGSNVVGMLGDPATPIKVIGVASQERWLRLPDSATFVEQGYDFTRPVWFGFVAPAGTPEAIVSKLSAEIEKILTNDESAVLLERFHMTPAYQNPADFGEQLRVEKDKLSIVLDHLGMAKQ